MMPLVETAQLVKALMAVQELWQTPTQAAVAVELAPLEATEMPLEMSLAQVVLVFIPPLLVHLSLEAAAAVALSEMPLVVLVVLEAAVTAHLALTKMVSLVQ